MLVAEPVRVGVAGLGRSGWSNHAQFLSRNPRYALLAVADPLAERRAEAEQTMGCSAYADPAELMADERLELVVVCTPSHTHAQLAVQALHAGRNVLVEKPMATSLAEAEAMIQAAEAAGRVLTVFQNRRWDPDFLRVKQILDQNVLGPVHLIRMGRYGYQRRHDWQTLRRLGGGLLNNWGAHVLDQALLLLGGSYRELFADLQRTAGAGDAEDHVKVVLRGENGTVVDVEITSGCVYPQPEWLVLGRYGSLMGNTRHLEWKYYDPAAAPTLVVDEGAAPGRSYGAPEQLPWQQASEDIPGINTTSAYYDRLYATLREGQPVAVTPQSVRDQIAMFDDIRRHSGFTGRP